MSTVHRHSSWIDSPPIAQCLSRSSFDPRDLRSDRMTIYLILPSRKLSVLSPLLRLWLGTIMHVLSRDEASEKHEVLFMLDEAAHLGKLQILEDAITLFRAYGMRFLLYFQSINQLQTVYGENAQTILDNCQTQVYFGTNAWESGEHISKRIGDCTILVESINRNWNRSRSYGQGKESSQGSVGSGDGITIAEQGRRLLRPEEILLLPRDTFIAFHKNLRPIAGELIRWDEAAEFKNGRTGRPRGVGLSGLLMAMMCLAISVVFAIAVRHLPPPEQLRQGFSPAARQRRPQPYYGQGDRQWPTYRSNRYQQPYRRDGFNVYERRTPSY
jgi:type IV secretion system protein VirD4